MPSATTPLSQPRLLLSVAETAQALGVSRTTVYELVNSGALPDVHVGRRRVIPARSVAAYVDSLHTGAAEAP